MKNATSITVLSLFLVAGTVSANAAQTPAVDAGPVVQNSQAMEAADALKQMNVRQQIQDQLTKAGFTDVTITPSSFYVHAKDKQGNPMAMVIGPDSFTEVTEMAPKAATAATMAPSSTAAAPKP